MSHPSAQNRASERYQSIRQSISRRTGTSYTCSSTDLRELTDPNGLLPYLGPRISVRDAARMLESQHSQPLHFKAYSALRHLRRLHELSRSDDWHSDLPFKIFGDIDDGLFGGELRAMIHMRWVTDEEIPDMAHLAAWTSTPLFHAHPSWGGERVCISLNARVLLLKGTMKELVGILVHECVVSFSNLGVVWRVWKYWDADTWLWIRSTLGCSFIAEWATIRVMNTAPTLSGLARRLQGRC